LQHFATIVWDCLKIWKPKIQWLRNCHFRRLPTISTIKLQFWEVYVETIVMLLQALQAFTLPSQLAGKSKKIPQKHPSLQMTVRSSTLRPKAHGNGYGGVCGAPLLSQSATGAVSEQTLQHPCVALAPDLGLVSRSGGPETT
jgi:hypothetical protein